MARAKVPSGQPPYLFEVGGQQLSGSILVATVEPLEADKNRARRNAPDGIFPIHPDLSLIGDPPRMSSSALSHIENEAAMAKHEGLELTDRWMLEDFTEAQEAWQRGARR